MMHINFYLTFLPYYYCTIAVKRICYAISTQSDWPKDIQMHMIMHPLALPYNSALGDCETVSRKLQ